MGLFQFCLDLAMAFMGRGLLLGCMWFTDSGPHELGFDPALCPANRAHLYCTAYERPKSIPAAKGKVLQVGGEFCRGRCLSGLPHVVGHAPRRAAAGGGHDAYLGGLATQPSMCLPSGVC